MCWLIKAFSQTIAVPSFNHSVGKCFPNQPGIGLDMEQEVLEPICRHVAMVVEGDAGAIRFD